MKISGEDFTIGDIYQLMTGTQRRSYEPMPPWSVLSEKLYDRSYSMDLVSESSPITRICISPSPFEDNERGVDFIIFTNSEYWGNKQFADDPYKCSGRLLVNIWYQYLKDTKKNHFIDRVVVIDDGAIVPGSSVEGQKVMFELYKHFEETPDIAFQFNSNSFHQFTSKKFYFGEEFREYLSVSDVDRNDAILGYVGCLIPLYINDIVYGNNIEKILYDKVGIVMQYIEEKEGN